MSRLTVQSLVDAGVNTLVNLCPTDPRWFSYINSFQARALTYGRWWGTTQLMQFCATPSTCGRGLCVVLPREVAVVEALTVNGAPLQPKNVWYSYVTPHREWVGCGLGSQPIYPFGGGGVCGCGCGCGPFVSEDKLTACSYQSTATGQKIRFYFSPADLGKKIIVQGYDSNNIWVRTVVGDEVIDGEQVTLALTGGQYFTTTTTAWFVGSPQAVIKDVTAYRVLMFSVDPDSGDDVQQLAEYQPSETLPTYRKLFIPGVRGGCGGGCPSNVKCIVSLNAIPVSSPNDWLLFGNVAAYEDGLQAVRYWREGDKTQGDAYFFGLNTAPRNRRGVIASVKLSGAIPTLTAELRKYQGDLTTVQVRRSGVLLPTFI